MPQYTITADGSTLIARSKVNRNGKQYRATVHAFGTFGGGTLKLQTSVDGGTTKLDADFETTANKADNVNLAAENHLTGGVELYATLSGATSPNITIDVKENG